MKNVNEGLYITQQEHNLTARPPFTTPTHVVSTCLLGSSRSTITESVGLRGGLGVGSAAGLGVDGHEQGLDDGAIEGLSALYARKLTS